MELNTILFPAPTSNYSEESLQGSLIWIPNIVGTKTARVHKPLQSFIQNNMKTRNYTQHQIKNKLFGKTHQNNQDYLKNFYSKNNCHNVQRKSEKEDNLFTTDAETDQIGRFHKIHFKSDVDEDEDEEEKSDEQIIRRKYKKPKNLNGDQEPFYMKRALTLSKNDINKLKNIFSQPQPFRPQQVVCNESVKSETESQTSFKNKIPLYKKPKTKILIRKASMSDLKTEEISPTLLQNQTKELNNQEHLPRMRMKNYSLVIGYSDNVKKRKNNPFKEIDVNVKENLRRKRQNNSQFKRLNKKKKKKKPPPPSSPVSTFKITHHIPVLFIHAKRQTPQVCLYFHSNGEDIENTRSLITKIRNKLKIHILAVEYPGYGVYEGSPSEERICKDAEAVYNFCIYETQLKPKDILTIGRSIGSGPAIYLASKYKLGALVLISSFTSIQAAVQSIAGGVVKHFIKQRFNNIEKIKKVTSPTFLIHGLMDELIPYQHSQQLQDACSGPTELYIPERMTHSVFHYDNNLTIPLRKFLQNVGYYSNRHLRKRNKKQYFYVPEKYFDKPKKE